MGLAWDAIVAECNGNLTHDAIAEAVDLASRALFKHAAEFVVEPAAP
jgi:hypothetical protein